MENLSLMYNFDGLSIYENPLMPETAPVALPDWKERLAAMVWHHIDLSLLDLTIEEDAVFFIDGRGILCHPRVLARIRVAVAELGICANTSAE